MNVCMYIHMYVFFRNLMSEMVTTGQFPLDKLFYFPLALFSIVSIAKNLMFI
jgi:hypothetical protein